MNVKNKIISTFIAISLLLSMCIGLSATPALAADTDIAEIKALTGLEPVSSNLQSGELSSSLDELPTAYNSANNGWVLPVRTQQNNTCWAFGALSTFETLLLKNGEDITTFSPQHANIWGTKHSDGTGWQRNEQNSGYSYIPLGYLTSQAGPVYDADFPTTATKSDYQNFSKSPEYVLTEAVFFNNNSSVEAIKELIYTYGAVVGNYNADGRFLSNGTSYYCSDHSFATSQLVGHCISVIGWDDNYARENFAQSSSGMPNSDGAWLFKNSWGANANSLGGYYWISYEDVWMFDQRFGPSYAFTDYAKVTEDTAIYQNEHDGATYEFTYLTDKRTNPCDAITYMNVFDFTQESRILDKVVFETTSTDADYTVYYIPCNNGTPTNNELMWTELSAGVVDFTGYICVDIENTELPEGLGAIGIRIDNTRTYSENSAAQDYSYTPNSIGVSEWLTSGGKLIFMPEAKFGMSYFMQGGVVRDVMDFYAKDFDDTVGGTFVIKAITGAAQEIPTEPTPDEPVIPDVPAEPTPDEPVPPVDNPTEEPSEEPTETPTDKPSEEPTDKPTEDPTDKPSEDPGFDFDEPVIYIVGDANGDNAVNVKDATLIQKHAASLVKLEGAAFRAADATEDNKVNVVDATAVQKFAAGIEFENSIGKQVVSFE